MDDFLIMASDKNYLKYCWQEIEKYIHSLNLKLNNKTKIVRLNDGLNFLGYRYILDGKKLRIKLSTRTKYRIKKRINNKESCLKNYSGYIKYSNVKLKVSNLCKICKK